MTNKLIVLLATIVTLLTIIASAEGAFDMNIFKNDFEKLWPELSQDVKKLNEYTKLHPVELRNVKAEDLDLEGVIFSGSTFSGVEWENIDASKSVLTKVVFRKCKFRGGKWEDGTLTDVLFEDCEFTDTALSGSTMTNVHFKSCKMDRTGIGYLSGGKVEFEDCQWEMGVGGVSSCQFEFRNCTIGGVMFMGMKNNVPLLIEGGVLDEVDFGKSHFSTVTLRRVKQGEGGVKFNDISADSISFEDVQMTNGTAIARSHVKSVRVSGGSFGTTFDDSIIGQISIRDTRLYYMEFSEVKLPKVTVSNCSLYNTGMWDGYIEDFTVQNSEFDIIVGENFKADTVVWHNVTLDGKIDFTNAQIKDFRPTDIKRGPNLQLITTGSNIRF